MSFPRANVRSAAILLAATTLAMVPARNTPADMVQIITQAATLAPGQSETISVQLTSTQNFDLGTAHIQIEYDNTRFSVSNVQLGSLDTDMGTGYGYTISTNNLASDPGILYATISPTNSSVASISTGQTGSLETFTLTALANAPLGGAVGDINLLATGGGQITVVDDYDTNAAITLSPAPTNGFDSTDGTVTVSPLVPEPSSLVLMGLGGGLIVATSRFRKTTRRPPAA